LQIPVNSLIIVKSINSGVISPYSLVLSTVVVGALLLIMIPVLFKIGTRLTSYS
jgi:hypothetical protein